MTNETHFAIATKFSLTPAEMRVAYCIVQGMGGKRAARELGLSYHTIRKQLQQIFSKTDTHRQSALAVLFLTPRQ